MEVCLNAECKVDQENFPTGKDFTKREWISVSAKDGVTWARFTLPPVTTKNQKKINEITLFKTLDIWQRREVSSNG